jgi:hypothetical protein
MSPEAVVSLCLLVPFIYAGLYTLTDPASSIRKVNKLMAEAHRIESNTILGDLFAEPTPITDRAGTRAWLRVAGMAIMAAGLFRLYLL